MHIELIGCTSSGKTSLIRNVIKAHGQNGFRLVSSYDFVLEWAHLGWVKSHQARMLFLNLITLLVCLLTWKKNHHLYRFIGRVIWHLPTGIDFREKIKIGRIAARNIGIDEIVRHANPEGQIVLADEGSLHIANYLFVHANAAPDLNDLDSFSRLVSLPDLIVYVREPEQVLVNRTTKRGHKRIPRNASELVQQFIKHSLVVFEHLTEYSALEDRLVIIDRGELLEPDRNCVEPAKLELTRKIFNLKPVH